MVEFKTLMGRIVWAVGGLTQDIAGWSTVVRTVERLRTDPYERHAQFVAEMRATLPAWTPGSARELEAAGQLTLFPLPVVPHLATQRGFSLSGMQVSV